MVYFSHSFWLIKDIHHFRKRTPEIDHQDEIIPLNVFIWARTSTKSFHTVFFENF